MNFNQNIWKTQWFSIIIDDFHSNSITNQWILIKIYRTNHDFQSTSVIFNQILLTNNEFWSTCMKKQTKTEPLILTAQIAQNRFAPHWANPLVVAFHRVSAKHYKRMTHRNHIAAKHYRNMMNMNHIAAIHYKHITHRNHIAAKTLWTHNAQEAYSGKNTIET